MPYGKNDRGYNGGTATMDPAVAGQSAPGTQGCGCGTPGTSTCCELVCFERPRYFCGHLLTDTDLSAAQQYVVDKHKLYHRSLHGHGIVCGLRLTCDPTCCGYIRIDQGYAIDDCGNDIVVCEATRFDVLARLKECHLLIPTAPRDPCKPETGDSPCPVRQCFYVVACYQETEHDFTTPLTPACGPSPKDCEATRVRETYTFDVVTSLPKSVNPLDDLKERLRGCFCLFTTDPFGARLGEIRDLLCRRDRATGEGTLVEGQPNFNYQTVFQAFCELRGLLLLYLKKHPDQYNCRLEEDVLAVTFPRANEISQQGASWQDAFARIIELAYNHVIDCVFGELTVPCPEQTKASCVVLGTVEVEDGCVVRVCNCPRSYVWSFASLFPVLAATLYGDGACETIEAPEQRQSMKSGCGCGSSDPTQTCCAHFTIDDPCAFLDNLLAAGKSAADVATAGFDTIHTIQQALRSAFNPADPTRLSAGAFIGRTLKDIKGDPLLKRVQYQAPRTLEPIDDPLQALLGSILGTKSDRFEFEVDNKGRVVDARREAPLYARLAQLEREVRELRAHKGNGDGDDGGPEAKARKKS